MAADAERARARDARPAQARKREPAPLALYRRYRPATFAELKGQDHVTEPLRQALRSGRVNHAYLFSGPRGCGKTSSARILARSLNCELGPTPDPCGKCASCVALAPVGPGQHRRDRDRRGLARRHRRRQGPARARVLLAGLGSLQDLHHRRSPHGDRRRLQRAAQARGRAAAAPQVRLRHHRAREGHPDHPVADAPLPVPARPARRSCATCSKRSSRPRRSASSRPCCRSWSAPGPGRCATRCRCSTSSSPAPDDEGLRYDRAIALLGYTDDALLDETVDAFAAGDGAARVQGDRPRRRGRPRPPPLRDGPAGPAARPDRAGRRA